MRALLLAALFLTACETTWHESASITSASGQRLCAKHRIPLITIRAYEAPTGWLVHEGSRPYYNVVGEHCPNHIPEHVALRSSGLLHVRTAIAYCPLCEKELLDGLRVSDQKKALEFAQYVLPIWGGSGVATKPPYQINLRGDVWTVNCFLVDGRKATIKFSKEKGSVISTKYGKRNSSNQALQPTADRRVNFHMTTSTLKFAAKHALVSGC